jgi:hypothetical protein
VRDHVEGRAAGSLAVTAQSLRPYRRSSAPPCDATVDRISVSRRGCCQKAVFLSPVWGDATYGRGSVHRSRQTSPLKFTGWRLGVLER